MNTHDTEQHIRTIITDWIAAIRAGDLNRVTAHHADAIVMFDVPPPQRGLRDPDAYRDAWPGFFAWIRSGAIFELDELDIVAGNDTAYAYALLRCGEPADLAATPDRRLRLTLGLVKAAGSWLIQHEHHSFTYEPDPYQGEESVQQIHQSWFAATARNDLDGIMAHIGDEVVSYEHEPPLEYTGADQVREVCRSGLEWSSGEVSWTVPQLTVIARDDLAVAWGLNRMTAEGPDGSTTEDWSRGTRVFRRQQGRWTMVHQHVSYPQDPAVGPQSDR